MRKAGSSPSVLRTQVYGRTLPASGHPATGGPGIPERGSRRAGAADTAVRRIWGLGSVFDQRLVSRADRDGRW